MQDRLHILEDLNMLYIRQMALSLEDTELQRKLDHEIRMREGACKLLAACSQREQALEATKSLLVCNSRILSYMGELQRRKEAQVLGKTGRRPSDSGPPAERSPCRGRVCISDLRIPLMWKDTEYFKNKGDLHRWAVFLLLQLGEQIQDTEMILVDRTLTDISFQSNVLFTEAGPDFELRLELYGVCVEEEGPLTGAPKRLATKLSSSLGRSSGRRVRASLDSAGGSGSSPILLPTPAVGGPRYHLLAHTTLTLAAVQDGFRTHDLTLSSHEDNPASLPLYGSVCCRLAAQPLCMTQPTASGTLRVKQAGELQNGTYVHGVLKGTNLFCYRQPGDADTGQEPLFTIAINKESRVRAGELEQAPGRPFTLSISNRYGDEEVTHTLQVESRETLQNWMEALWQLFFDMSQWKQCCDEVMKIETPAPRKPPQALAKQGSLYHEMAIEPLDDIAAVTDILAQREGTRLEKPPPWLAMFTDQPALSSPCSPVSVASAPVWTQPLPWGRPRTFSLDAVPPDHSPGASRLVAPPPLQQSPGSRGLYSKSQLRMWLQSPV
ncbi:rhotekin isoform X2 [Nannospalax galili]|uniref:Rhotekin n=1 Tax=Nannospalax galili TaxID=1026970 RepID=A0A8C6W2U6_NANGA|nr:rhotekin isoform X2 [Nannospalax galili]XP_008822980.1 rhotekin isoform X2 [Nannospalax galili]XP_017651496.1 rhotekin isoform X2 [Nannospalax galili]